MNLQLQRAATVLKLLTREGFIEVGFPDELPPDQWEQVYDCVAGTEDPAEMAERIAEWADCRGMAIAVDYHNDGR